MSGRLAIATLTATLERQLLEAAQSTVPEAKMRLGSPITTLTDQTLPVVNLYLYQARPNPQLSNAHLPTRRGDGTQVSGSRIVLDISYLISFYGDPAKYIPERLMAAVALALESEPVLDRKKIEAAIAANEAILKEQLPAQDLHRALSRVRVTREPMSLDDLSKTWSIFFQVPYALSAAYQCSHLVVEADERPTPALPVAEARIWSSRISALSIEAIESAEGAGAPIT